jgi:hypothetical protein
MMAVKVIKSQKGSKDVNLTLEAKSINKLIRG